MTVPELAARPPHVSPERVVDFDIYDCIISGKGFQESWKAFQEGGHPDIIWTPRNGGHFIVLKGALVERVLQEHEIFSNHTVLVPKETAGNAYRLIPLSLDPPDHAPFRKLLDNNLNPKAIREIEVGIRELTVGLIKGFKADGRCNFTEDFAEQLPIRIFMQLVDLPMEDLPTLKHLADQFTRPDGSMDIMEVKDRFRDYLVPVIKERRGSGRTDLLSSMISGEVNGRPLSDQEAVDLCTQTLVGGLDTVVNFMGFVMLYLARTPAVQSDLRQNPKRIPRALAELLRRYGLVASAREVAKDAEINGVKFAPGDMVVAPTMLHGLDDDVAEHPMDVRFDRPALKHATFGAGPHRCPGSHLAMSELKIMVEEWLERVPEFSLAPDTRVEYQSGIVGSVRPYELVWLVQEA
jgi:cytochrome P450